MGIEPNARNTSKRTTVARASAYGKMNVRGGSHAGGFHLVVHGKNTGACLCLNACCYDASFGCICRQCSGKGHASCIELNVVRAKRRTARAKADAKASQARADALAEEGELSG